MTSQPGNDSSGALKEFCDRRMWVKYALGVIGGLGVGGIILLIRNAGGAIPTVAVAAIAVATVVALAVVYLPFGKPVHLRQMADRIEWSCGTQQRTILYDELAGFRAKWTNVIRNGVYSHTNVRLGFSAQDPSEPVLTCDVTADFDTLKYNQLQEFQGEIAEIVAQQMAAAIERDGKVKWTDKLALYPNAFEMRKKPSAAPEVIGFDRVTRWTIDQGLFKLGIDGIRRPLLLEETSQWNFYPGLLLFSHLCQRPSDEASIDDEEPALVG